MNKFLKPVLLSIGTIGVGYFIAQREYDFNLGIYDSIHSQLYKQAPWYSVQFMKFMNYQKLFWKQEINSDGKTISELQFRNQLGLASGYDNDGSYIESLQNLGFGFIEIGSISPQKSISLTEDCNQYLSKNNIVDYVSELPQMGILKTKAMISSLRKNNQIQIPIGINIMPSEDICKYTPYLIGNDISNVARELCTLADYFTLNLVSGSRTSRFYSELISNNVEIIKQMIETIKTTQTEEIGLQAALQYEQLNQLENDNLISNYLSATTLGLKQTVITPLYVKISSNYSKEVFNLLQACAVQNQIQGIIIQKDTTQPENEHLLQLSQIKSQMPKNCALISVGGISTKSQYQERLKTGADACQILSSFIIKGPQIIKEILL